MNAGAWEAATQAGNALGIDPNVLYGQFAGETGNFSTNAAQANNFAGVMLPGTSTQQKFSSPSSFASYFTNLIQTRYPNAIGAGSNVNQYVSGLSSPFGTYYAGTNPTTGMQETANMYSAMITGNMPTANLLSQLTANATGTNTGGAVSNPGGTVSNPTGKDNVTNKASAAISTAFSKYGMMIFGIILIIFAIVLSQRGTIITLAKGIK